MGEKLTESPEYLELVARETLTPDQLLLLNAAHRIAALEEAIAYLFGWAKAMGDE